MIFTVAGAHAAAQDADVATPEYQVKLLLTDSAVDESGNPSQQLRDAFNISADSEGSEESTWRVEIDGIKTDLEIMDPCSAYMGLMLAIGLR